MRNLCSFPLCARPAHGNGLCAGHVWQKKTGKDLRPLKPVTLPFSERFWSRVDKDGPVVRAELGQCWIWTGHKTPRGYGSMSAQGKGNGSLKAHRVSWELAKGDIPNGHGVLHKCDNPPCVNPAHLFTGTQKDNFDDMVAKGRGGFDELHRLVGVRRKR